ncbi:hypothetical protein [Rossellomorea vietnamensis]|uniref:hypothetical protein n=1 Tax=Rossellomorea vietnamensis TaxID=218284 RepID=UPI001E309D26|nr:hypothetical protein [Rossellomorea vietnamensis]MCC5801846.1 hypothetical protein [Rossellomorea vietnamensis]
MPLRVDIPDDSLEYLTSEAKDELKTSILKYNDDIVNEAGRLEATIRSTETPEITRHFIKEAVIGQKNPYRINKTLKKETYLQLCSTITIFISGLIFDFDQFKESSILLIIFLFMFSIALITTVLSFRWRD